MSSAARVQRFFGQYLIESGLITPGQLNEGLAYSVSNNRRIGDYIVEAGYCDQDDIETLKSIQRMEDRPIGELVVEAGFMEYGNLAPLLTQQAMNHVPLGEALVKLGFVRSDVKDVLLSGFHARMATDSDRSTEDPMVQRLIDGMPRVLSRLSGVPAVLVPRSWPLGQSRLVVRTGSAVPDTGLRLGFGSDSTQTAEITAGLLGIEEGFCDPRRCNDAWFEILDVVAAYAGVAREDQMYQCDLPQGGYAFDILTPQGSGAFVVTPASA